MAHRHPGLFRILTTCFRVSASLLGGVMSILSTGKFVAANYYGEHTLVTQITTGTPRASVMARCSLLMPYTIAALAFDNDILRFLYYL